MCLKYSFGLSTVIGNYRLSVGIDFCQSIKIDNFFLSVRLLSCSLTDSFQHLSGENYNWRTGRSQRNSQHRRQSNYQRTFCWWHWWPGRIRGGTSLPGGSPGPLAWKIVQRNPNWWLTTLDEVESFKYLGAVVTDQGSRPEVLSRIAQTTAAPARMKTIWNDNHISLSSKITLMRSLVISVLLCACEIWTLIADILKKLQATEM